MTGMSRAPTAVDRLTKSFRTAHSSTGSPRSLYLATTGRRRMRSGAWVAMNTSRDGVTASVLMVSITCAGSQQRYPRKSDIGRSKDGDVGHDARAAWSVGVDHEQRVRRVRCALQPDPLLVVPAQQGERGCRVEALGVVHDPERVGICAPGQDRKV